MPTETIHLVGSGGHALVVLDSLLALGVPLEAVGVHDQHPDRIGKLACGRFVEALDEAELAGRKVHICIGDNAARARLTAQLLEAGCVIHSIIDPRAIVSPSAQLGAGSFVAPGAIIAAAATLGRGAIVNHGAIVDHECVLDEFVHIAPGATLAGKVAVGRLTLVGAGANVLPGVSVGAGTIIGAGAVVIDRAADGAVYVGVPARKVN